MRFAPFFVLRTPLLEAREEVEELAATLAQPEVREAIRWASPSLAETLAGERAGRRETLLSAARYVARMRGRPTPFATLAGYSWGKVHGAETSLELSDRAAYRRIARLDVEAVHRLVAHEANLAPDSARWIVRGDLLHFPDTIRVVQRAADGETVKTFDVERTPPLQALLAVAQIAAPFDDLVAAVLPSARNPDHARRFVLSVIENGLLVSALIPSVLVDDELVPLDALPATRDLAVALRGLRDRPLLPEGELAERVGALGLDPRDLIIDMVKPTATATLGRDVMRPLQSVIDVLWQTRAPARDLRLNTFADRFRERYGTREVPLVEALDPRRGLDFPFGKTAERPLSPSFTWKLGLLGRALQENKSVEVSLADLPGKSKLPSGAVFSVSFSLARDPLQIWSPVVIGSPGTAAYARAAAVLPPSFHTAVVEMLATPDGEGAADEDVCDLAYFLPGKSASFSQYPPLFPLEINLTEGRAGSSRSLDVNEIFVSAPRTGLRLRSRETGRMLRLSTTSAAVYERQDATPLVRFLSHLARTSQPGFSWSWEAAQTSAFLPRVSYEGHVLSPATWNASATQTAALRAAKTQAERWDRVQALRQSLGWPRFLRFHEQFDHVLPVDLEDRWSVDAWLDIARAGLTVSEAFPADRSAVSGPEGRYHHEIIAPFRTATIVDKEHPSPPRADTREPLAPVDAADAVEEVLPGGDLLFLRISGDVEILVDVLARCVDETIRPARQAGALGGWFFRPFADARTGTTAIELALLGEPGVLWSGRLLGELRAIVLPHVASRALRAMDVVTFARESYRFGGARGARLAEVFFEASSELSLELSASHDLVADDLEPEALVAVVGSLRAALAASGLSLGDQKEVARRAAEDIELTMVGVRHRAGGVFRELGAQLLSASAGTDPGWRERLQRLALELPKPGAVQDRLTWWTSAIEDHVRRLLPPWRPTREPEGIVLWLLVKLLATEAARPGLTPPSDRASAPSRT